MQSEADPSGSEASDCEAGDTFYVAAPELNLSEDSDDDAAAASVVMPPAPDEYVRQLGDQLSIFTLVGDKLDEARAGGARWRVLNELVAPFVGSNEPVCFAVLQTPDGDTGRAFSIIMLCTFSFYSGHD